MANHKSAEKRIKRNQKRADINRSRISRIRTFVKNVEKAILAGDKQVALNAFKVAEPEMQRGVVKGVLHQNTVSRKLSRLASHINALA